MSSGVRPCCPHCHGDLLESGNLLACTRCDRRYPVVLGIPDLRTAPDPWIGLVEDRAKGARVDAEAGPSFEAAVRHYWTLTPETASADAARHIAHVLHAEQRSREWLATLSPPAAAGERWLDLGCGTADLACAVPDGVVVTGVDVAFRWLVIAQRRLREAGRAGALVCGNAEQLPFPDASVDRVIALGTLEHCADIDAVLREARRVLRPGGRLHLRAANRYSLLPEPHVGLLGVGWLPRRLADRYVRWRGGVGYAHHWPRGAAALARALGRAGFVQHSVEAARMMTSERDRLPVPLTPLIPLYHALRGAPLVGRAIRSIAPLLDAQGVAP